MHIVTISHITKVNATQKKCCLSLYYTLLEIFCLRRIHYCLSDWEAPCNSCKETTVTVSILYLLTWFVSVTDVSHQIVYLGITPSTISLYNYSTDRFALCQFCWWLKGVSAVFLLSFWSLFCLAFRIWRKMFFDNWIICFITKYTSFNILVSP